VPTPALRRAWPACARGLTALALCAATALAQAVQVDLRPEQPGPVIARHIYGQFAEHLGTGIYEGLWVGPHSPIPNRRGWRIDVVDALKALKVPVVRWPGGCFADEYHWRDGIGPRDQRPVRVNTNWGGVAEPNAVGTHEFFDLVEQLGTEAYVNGNLGTGSAQEMSEWLEYMTSDGTGTLARQRRANGHEAPFRVHFFAVGNEAWGCGGNMKPDYYANLYRQAATFLKAPRGNRPVLVASGGNGEDLAWTEVLSREVKPNLMQAISHHRYTLPTDSWSKKGAAVGFPEAQWISTLVVPQKIDANLAKHREILDRNDPKKRIGFYFDEWGSWYDPEPGTNPGFLVQRNTLRDAVLAALHFHVFHKHAERVRMTNIAQMVNVLQAMVQTRQDRLVLTPTYHAFEMHVPFQDATFVPVVLQDNPAYARDGMEMPQLSASAARSADGRLVLSLVNANPRDALELDLRVGGQAARAVQGRVLTAAAMDAENGFDQPAQVLPRPIEARVRDGRLTLSVPAKSVVVLTVEP